MPPAAPDRSATLLRGFGNCPAPSVITQKAFDFDDGHLRRLARLDRGARPDADDLWDYANDLRYTDIQSDLLVYVLPFCMQAWRDDLRGTDTSYGAFVEELYPVLADRQVFDRHLSPAQSDAVHEFMRQSILDEIDDQRGLVYAGMNARPYRWIRALTTCGVLAPDLELLWKDWWSLETHGRAVSALQYVSALLYPDADNPLFARWTRDDGGGPPCLWEFAGHLYNHRWVETNVDFLRRTLTPSAVNDVVKQATERLLDAPEHAVAMRIESDLPHRAGMLERRCAELPLLLATMQDASVLLEWSAEANEGRAQSEPNGA